jgi:N-acetylglucosamine-6-phosphate deacetylase
MRIHAQTLYDGTGGPARHGCLITLEGGRIAAIDDGVAAPRDVQQVEIAAPGFLDLQINGAADVQLNDDPSPEAMERIAEGAARGGAMHILPTYITAPGAGWIAALEAAAEARRRALPGVLGLHLEGPFLSPERPGIHPAAAIRPMRREDAERLAAADLPLLLTLAPEAQDPALLTRLAGAGLRLFAGHSVASAAELESAVQAGVIGVTHLWNAMPPPAGRAPGMVSRTLTHETLFAGIIADGHHVDPINLALAARMMPDRLFLVSDSMRTYAGVETGFDLMGTPVRLREGRLTGPDGTLAGAHLGMDEAVATMVRQAGCAPAAAIAMASHVPARVMGLQAELGLLRPGHRASVTFLTAELRAAGGLRDGQPV